MTFQTPVSRTYRLCRDCWALLRDDNDAIRALISEESAGAGMANPQQAAFFAESRCWHDVADYVGLIEISDDEEWLAKQARLIVDMAGDFDGPMPAAVAKFISTHDKPR